MSSPTVHQGDGQLYGRDVTVIGFTGQRCHSDESVDKDSAHFIKGKGSTINVQDTIPYRQSGSIYPTPTLFKQQLYDWDASALGRSHQKGSFVVIDRLQVGLGLHQHSGDIHIA